LRDSWAVPFEIRLGGAFKNGFYFTTDLAFDYGPVGGLQLSIHLGYNFQHK